MSFLSFLSFFFLAAEGSLSFLFRSLASARASFRFRLAARRSFFAAADSPGAPPPPSLSSSLDEEPCEHKVTMIVRGESHATAEGGMVLLVQQPRRNIKK